MRHEVTISEKTASEIYATGTDLKTAVEGSYSFVSGEASYDKESAEFNQMQSFVKDMDIKVSVFGGAPPPSGAGTEAAI